MKSLKRSFALVSAALIASACAEDGSFTLTLEQSAIALDQGTVDTVAINVSRSSFSKPITFSVTGLPTGVTAAFLPSTISGTVSKVILTAAGFAEQGEATIVIHATGEGVTERTQELTITTGLTGTFSLSSEGFPATGAQGGAAVGTILVVRNDGHGDNVTLVASGLPTGVSASFVSTKTTGNAMGLTLNVANSVATGNYPITITGSAPGLEDKTTQVTLDVVAAPSTASLTVPFCPNNLPAWFAYKNEGYAWQQATPTGSGVTFQATDALAVAYVFITNTSQERKSEFVVNYATRAELSARHLLDCNGSKALTGTTVLNAGQGARISMGAATTSATSAMPNFAFSNVATRTLDLVATRGVMTTSLYNIQITPDKLLLQRALNPGPGTSLGSLDFAANGITPQSNNVTIANKNVDDSLNLGTTFWTGTNTYGVLHVLQPAGTTNAMYSMPAANMQAGEFHELLTETYRAGFLNGRLRYNYIASMSDHTETLGANLLTPGMSIISTSPYVRFYGQLTSQPDYPTATQFLFLQAGASATALDRWLYIVQSAGYRGGTPTTWEVRVPQFGSVTGLDYSWLFSSSSVPYQAEGYGGPASVVFGGNPVAGDFQQYAYYVGQTGTLGSVLRKQAAPLFRGKRIPLQYFRR